MLHGFKGEGKRNTLCPTTVGLMVHKLAVKTEEAELLKLAICEPTVVHPKRSHRY